MADKGIAIAEQGYLARERVLTAKQKQFLYALPRLLERYQDWRELVQVSGAKAAKSLSQQWQAGMWEYQRVLAESSAVSRQLFGGLKPRNGYLSELVNVDGRKRSAYAFLDGSAEQISQAPSHMPKMPPRVQ